MVRLVRGLAVMAGVFSATACFAQTPGLYGPSTGFQAGDVVVRVRAIGVIPENIGSSVSAIGGHVGVTDTPAPEVDLSYFFSDHFAAELIAASTRHEITANGSSLGRVDVGSTYVLPPTLTAQYHFLPKGMFDPYIGVGLTVAFWYDTHAAGGAVTKVGLSTSVGPAVQVGVNMALGGPWFANFDVKQTFLDTRARIDGGAIVAKTSISPTIVGAGIGYRF